MHNSAIFCMKIVETQCRFKKYGNGSQVFITEASGGIGIQLAIKFSKEGFKIILVALSAFKIRGSRVAMANEITQFMDNISLERLIQEVGERVVSTVINNIGVDAFSSFHVISDEVIYKTIKVNCLSVTILIKRFIPQLLRGRSYISAILKCDFSGKVNSNSLFQFIQ
ncbi:unnamed protein product [Paramecium octaurelia]|uniref:Uncharacterized protein n=1 Tax=Paramecium octaurelia TaxID=43137 RepID=A0A8S1XEF8_PAROT|nr:unnamed protein product [Paramecium octaurelia]